MRQALISARDAKVPYNIVTALAYLAAILADDKPEQAIELYTLASRHPSISHSRFWQDLLEPSIVGAADRLPPEVVKAAQARGQEEDWATVTECWIRELGEDHIDCGMR